jgi:steroid delta-isomerase-like uncharacterized protein
MENTPTAKQVLERYHEELWVKRNLDALAELIHHDFADDSRKDFSAPGPEYARTFFRSLFASFPDLKSETKVLIGDGSTAAIMWELSGTYNGASLWGKPVTGKSFKVRGIDVLEIKDGKIIRDYGGMVDQFPKIFGQLGL